jgi:hypothetical protein
VRTSFRVVGNALFFAEFFNCFYVQQNANLRNASCLKSGPQWRRVALPIEYRRSGPPELVRPEISPSWREFPLDGWHAPDRDVVRTPMPCPYRPGMRARSSENDSSPPAEAPMPTIEKDIACLLEFVAYHAVDREALTWKKWEGGVGKRSRFDRKRKRTPVCPFTLLRLQSPSTPVVHQWRVPPACRPA